MTLLQHREEQLKEALDIVLHFTETLKICIDNKYSDTDDRLFDLAKAVQKAAILQHKVNDLRDVQRYGPTGGIGV